MGTEAPKQHLGLLERICDLVGPPGWVQGCMQACVGIPLSAVSSKESHSRSILSLEPQPRAATRWLPGTLPSLTPQTPGISSG